MIEFYYLRIAGLAAVVLMVLTLGVTAKVYKSQRDTARAEIARIKAEGETWRVSVESALKDAADRVKKTEELEAWIKAHPAPSDAEALRRWALEAGKR